MHTRVVRPFRVDAPEVDGVVEVREAPFGHSVVLVDGRPAAAGSFRGRFLLPRSGGGIVEATVLDELERVVLVIDGRARPAGPRIERGVLVLAMVPLLLGGVGGIPAAIAVSTSSSLARRIPALPLRILATLVISISIWLACGILALLVLASLARL